MNTFSSFSLPPAFLDNLAKLDYHAPTPVQAAVLPPALEGKDVTAQARTGSGKTAAFSIPMLLGADFSRMKLQGLVLCPTRELAEQVAGEVRRLAKFAPNVKVVALPGGVPLRPQAASLAHGAHIAVGTPGRILDLMDKGNLHLSSVKTLVLDEADRMLEMGFGEDVAKIAAAAKNRKQTLLFSATFPEGVRELGASLQKEPVQIQVEHLPEENLIDEYFLETEAGMEALPAVLEGLHPSSALIFTATKEECRRTAAFLDDEGFHVLALHGDLDQHQRNDALAQFANGSARLLVATDVAARGLDIPEVGMVIQLGAARDLETYLHRIGRTGRKGHRGTSLLIDDAPLERQEVKPLDLPEPRGPYPAPEFATLLLERGRKDKIRPGDVLGLLSGPGGLKGEEVGKIQVADRVTYAAIRLAKAEQTLKRLKDGTIKKLRVRTWLL